MSCDRRRYGCNNHRNRDIENGIIELNEGLRLMQEGLRDLHCNRPRQAEREFRMACREVEEGLCDVVEGLREGMRDCCY